MLENIFSQTTTVRFKQKFLMSWKKTELGDIPAGCTGVSPVPS